MSKQVKLTDEAYEVLAAAEGNSFSERVINLARNTSTTDINDRLTKMAQYLEKRFNELEEKVGGGVVWEDCKGKASVPKELEGLEVDELPPCCQEIFADQKPHCEHWERAMKNGQLSYRNTLTGYFSNDQMYHKYV